MIRATSATRLSPIEVARSTVRAPLTRREWSKLAGTLALAACGLTARVEAGEPERGGEATGDRAFRVETLRGKVVWFSAALQQRKQIQQVPEAAERVLALETERGALVPLVEDVRGRAFRRDERLRSVPVELVVRRYADMPFAQVLGVFQTEQGQRLELDYWCQVCAIAMYELKDCECCQGPIELRRRPVK